MLLATKSAAMLAAIQDAPLETKATAATARRPLAIVTDDADPAGEFALTIRGYAATFDPDLGGDLIMPGAFRDLEKWRAAGDDPIQFVDFHNYTGLRMILGRLIDAREDEHGLLATFGVVRSQETEHARELVKTKSITGLSIGYRVPRGGQREPDARLKALGVNRILDKIALHEVSLVMSPMNPSARVTSPEKGMAPDDPRRAEPRWLTEHRAKRAAAETADRAAKLAALKVTSAELRRGIIAPDDPQRIAMDTQLRDLKLRGLRLRISHLESA